MFEIQRICPTCGHKLKYIKTKGGIETCPLEIYECINKSCNSKRLSFGRFGYINENSTKGFKKPRGKIRDNISIAKI